VLVGVAVVADRAALEGVLGRGERDGLRGAGRLARELERGQRGARVPARAGGEELERLGRDRLGVAPALLDRALEQTQHVLRGEHPQLVDLGAREQRGVDLEVGILRRRPDQRHEALLDRGKERVLLGLVEAVDLVEEEDRRLSRALLPVLGALEHGAHLGATGLHRALLFEGRAGPGGDDARERRLAATGRAEEDHGVRATLLDRPPQGRAGVEQMLLSDELRQRRRAHPRGERRCGAGAGAPPLALRRLEQGLHRTRLARRSRARPPPHPRAGAPRGRDR